MSAPLMIGLTGKARSGKDTAAGVIIRHGFTQFAFANPLKETARYLFGFNDAQVYGDLKEELDPYWGVTPRHVLQQFGTEAMRRVFGPDFWLQVMDRQIAVSGEQRIVISDVRFENEADFVRARGGILFHISRNSESPLAAEAQQHVSEAGVSLRPELGDQVLENGGTLGDFNELITAKLAEVSSDV